MEERISSTLLWKFGVMLMISFMFMAMNALGLGEKTRHILGYVINPVAFFASDSGSGFRDFFSSVSEASSLRKDFNNLKIKYADYEAEKAEIELIKRENAALKDQLGVQNNSIKYQKADVVDFTKSEAAEYMVINKGKREGIKKSQVVVSGNNFIGIVSSVDGQSAKIRLASNRASNLEVIIIDSEGKTIKEAAEDSELPSKAISTGIAVGSESTIKVENISGSAKIDVGDYVFISDSRVGSYLYLGKIGSTVEDPAAASKEAFVESAVNIKELTYVFVINK